MVLVLVLVLVCPAALLRPVLPPLRHRHHHHCRCQLSRPADMAWQRRVRRAFHCGLSLPRRGRRCAGAARLLWLRLLLLRLPRHCRRRHRRQ